MIPLRRQIPADNSCLFNAFSYVYNPLEHSLATLEYCTPMLSSIDQRPTVLDAEPLPPTKAGEQPTLPSVASGWRS